MRTKNELYQEALRTVARRRQIRTWAKAEDARAEAEAAVPGCATPKKRCGYGASAAHWPVRRARTAPMPLRPSPMPAKS